MRIEHLPTSPKVFPSVIPPLNSTCLGEGILHDCCALADADASDTMSPGVLTPDKERQDLCDEAIEKQDLEKLLVLIEAIKRPITEKEPREKPILPK